MDFAFACTIYVTSVIFQSPFEFYFYYIIILALYPYFFFKYGISKKLLLILGTFFVLGIYNVALGNCEPFNFIKVWGGVFMHYTFFYMYVKHQKFDVHKMVRFYLKCSYIVSIIGIIQEISYVLHFPPGYNYRWLFGWKWGLSETMGGLAIRVNSTVAEPSYLGALLAPAVFISVATVLYKGVNLDFYKTKHKITILIAYLLTFSSTSYMGIGFIAILLLLNTASVRQVFLSIIFFVGIISAAWNVDEGFSYRVNSMVSLLNAKNLDKVINKKLGIIDPKAGGLSSSFVLYASYDVARQNFAVHPIIGTGFGSFPSAFDKYSIFRFLSDSIWVNNRQDGNSQFVRLMTETGLLGLSIMFLFIYLNYIRKAKSGIDQRYWVYSNAMLIIILMFLLRQGNYFLTAFPWFMWLYHINHVNYRNELKKLQEK